MGVNRDTVRGKATHGWNVPSNDVPATVLARPRHDTIGVMSTVTQVPPAPADVAARHFAMRLALETDAADVGSAVAGGAPDFTIVDVRSRADFAAGHVRGAVSLPHGEIDATTAGALPDGLLVVYCWGPGCNGAQRGAARLAAHGRVVKEMIGGYEYYSREGWPVVTTG